MRKSSQLQIWLLTGIVALLLIIVPITGFLNNLSGEKKANSGSSTYDVGDAAFVSQFSGLFVWAYVTFIDVSTFSYRLHLVLEPSGAFIDNERLSRTVSLFVNGRPTLLPANQPASTQDFTVTFAEGDMNKYPFDYYADALHVFAQTNVTSGSPETVPLAFSFSGHIQGWNIASSVKETQGDVELLLNLTRSGTTKFFSLFIVILMWALSLTILALAVTLWIRKRKVEPPTIAVGAALLFALPAIRNTQVHMCHLL